MELALSSAGPPRPQVERLTFRRVLIFSPVFLTVLSLCPVGRSGATAAGSSDQRNVVADYLNGAEQQSESDDQGLVIKQAFTDMLNEPVESLRKKRYPDYQMHPNRWPITELLYRYIVPGAPVSFKGDEFFRDVKKTEAQKVIRIWLDYENRPSGIEGPPGPTSLNCP